MAQRALVVVMVVLGACASIARTETFVDRPLEPATATSGIGDSTTYDVVASTRGEVLTLEIGRSERCRTVTTPRSHRTSTVTRTADTKFMSTTWALAGLSLLLGVGAYAGADGLSEMDRMNDPASTSTPGQYRTTGGVLVGIGLVAGLVGIGNSLRAVDSVDDRGVLEGTVDSNEHRCRNEQVTGEEVILQLGHIAELSGTTDDDGNVEFSFTDVTTNAMPGPQMRLVVRFLDAELPVDVRSDKLQQIASAVAANPDSRFNRELATRRRMACRAAVDVARSATDAELAADPDQVMATWSAARLDCGDDWTDDDEAAVSAVRMRADLLRCNAALQRIDALLGFQLDRQAASAVEAELENAELLCTANKRVQAARAEYAEALEDLEESEAMAAAEEALYDALADVENAMADNDSETAYRFLKAVPKLKKIFSENTKALAWGLLDAGILNVLDSYPSKKEAGVAMCFSRNVFKLVVGSSALKKAVQTFVDRVGSRDPDHAAKVIKALKAGRCK